MDLKGKIVGISKNIFNEKTQITLEVDRQPAEIESLIDKVLRITLGIWREKRSLNANAYCWALIQQIADVVRLSKEEVYYSMLKHYGQSEVVSMLANIEPEGYFKYYEEIGSGYVNDKEFKHYRVFKGSSEFNTREMSILLDGIIHEAEQIGIHTITPKEAEKMKARWDNEI